MTPLEKELALIAWEAYKVVTIFADFKSDDGVLGDFSKGIIFVYKEESERKKASTFFHELGHAHCYRNNMYPAYHGLKTPQIKFRGDKAYYFLPMEVFKIEQIVDGIGKGFYNAYGFYKRYGRYDVCYLDKDYKSFHRPRLLERFEFKGV